MGSNVINSNIDRIVEDAKANNLEYIGLSTKGKNYRRYRFLGCSHEQDLQVAHVRRGVLECKSCFNQEVLDRAKFHNLVQDTSGVFIRECGHSYNYKFPPSIGDSITSCQCCREDKYTEEAKAAGLEYIGKAGNGKGDYRKYKLQCGHIAAFALGHVRRNNVACKDCASNKLIKEAESAGLKLLGYSCRKKNYRQYELPCGCISDLNTYSVRNKIFCCKTHSTKARYLSVENNIYLLRLNNSGFRWLKLGFAKNINKRIKGYGLSNNTSVEILQVINMSSGAAALSNEKRIHSILFGIRLNPNKMKEFHSSGFSECYPDYYLDVLLGSLSSIEN